MEKGCGFFSWDHSKTEVAAEETCEHLQAGSPLHPPQGLHKLRGLEKQTADPQLGSETTRNACTGLLNPASPNMRATWFGTALQELCLASCPRVPAEPLLRSSES